jgi:hypothetical protein
MLKYYQLGIFLFLFVLFYPVFNVQKGVETSNLRNNLMSSNKLVEVRYF